MYKNDSEPNRDDTLDYMVFEDINNEIGNKTCNSGCMSLLVLVILPLFIIRHYF